VLQASQLEELLHNVRVIFTFTPAEQEVTRKAFSSAFDLQLKVVVGFAAALFPSILLMLKFKRNK
jgi:hypothetical protein